MQIYKKRETRCKDYKINRIQQIKFIRWGKSSNCPHVCQNNWGKPISELDYSLKVKKDHCRVSV